MSATPKRRMRQKPIILSICALLALLMSQGHAATSGHAILAISSERSAPALVAGAHQLLEQHPELQISIRTTGQLASLNDKQLHTLIERHQSLLLIGVFGDPVVRLLAAPYPQQQRRFVIHSDRRLMALNRDRHGIVFANNKDIDIPGESHDLRDPTKLEALQKSHPRLADWLQLRAYWVNRSANNARSLFEFVNSDGRKQAPIEPVSELRFFVHQGSGSSPVGAETLTLRLQQSRPIVWLLDHDTGDLGNEWTLHKDLCESISAQCVSVLAAWGEPSVRAINTIQSTMGSKQSTPWAVLALQDFVIGGGDGRNAVIEKLKAMNVPVLKGLRLSDWSQFDHRLSPQGIPSDSVHYRVAMPELQGISQPQVLALSAPSHTDPTTGARLNRSQSLKSEISRQTSRLERWFDLQMKSNANKRVAIIYYNHPPGRHNIGADNLNVPDSLLQILRALKAEGYQTGDIPETREALLDILQQRGVNLPEDAKALNALSKQTFTLSNEDYQRWFDKLPASVQAEMVHGPLAALHEKMVSSIQTAIASDSLPLRQSQLDHLHDHMRSTISDLRHALDGLRHKGRLRALNLLEQLEHSYAEQIRTATASANDIDWTQSTALRDALIRMNIEGLRGWGDAPGNVMVWQNQMLIPGVQFGNVFVGPQPPRGWEINEELLHANLSFPPPHQYLGFYHYLQSIFKADALVHLGRHSTYEFLPRRGVGVAQDDYPSIIAGDLPGLYPYIVDGVGEGIQAKRRGLAVMVDHLTPPLAITELYDDLLQLRQLIESAEAASDSSTRTRAIEALRNDIDRLGLREELIASMDEELKVRGIGFDAIDDDFLLHEVGHYLTHIQERFMPLGLHVFGQDWQESAVDTMIQSMRSGSTASDSNALQWKQGLQQSPRAEMDALLTGLSGGFVAPGKGNDPIRTPEALPTGRNFYALDGSLLPTRIGYDLGQQLAQQVLADFAPDADKGDKQGVILWASDAVRDEGAMIAFGMKLLGVRPVWNSRGIIQGLERMPLSIDQPYRLDVMFTTSGLFRDLYGEHLLLLDKASLMALDASADLIKQQFPALALALDAALTPLSEWRRGGNEPLEKNRVAKNWVDHARYMLAQQPQISPETLGRNSSISVFGIAPGSYGAGINRLTERSGAWQNRSELAAVFTKRMGHAYGVGLNGESTPALFRDQLASVSHTFLGRASNLYGLIDNNDAFDYLGGFNLAVESSRGSQPKSSVILHANQSKVRISDLSEALLSELRGRFLNPQWIKPLMEEGYAGARTMGSEFLEYLWGWQVTSPHIIDNTVWERVKAVYVDDSLNLELDEFLSENHNRHVHTNMLAIMLVAIDKGFWQAEPTTVQELSRRFADNILEVGLPGSGHTHPNHPMYELVSTQLEPAQAEALQTVLEQSRMQPSAMEQTGTSGQASHIQELILKDSADDLTAPHQSEQASASSGATEKSWLAVLAVMSLLLVAIGFIHGHRGKHT